MDITLTPECELIIQDKINCGKYISASEVVVESLRLLKVHDELYARQFEQLNQVIDVGLQQLDKGEKISALESFSIMRIKINNSNKDD